MAACWSRSRGQGRSKMAAEALKPRRHPSSRQVLGPPGNQGWPTSWRGSPGTLSEVGIGQTQFATGLAVPNLTSACVASGRPLYSFAFCATGTTVPPHCFGGKLEDWPIFYCALRRRRKCMVVRIWRTTRGFWRRWKMTRVNRWSRC